MKDTFSTYHPIINFTYFCGVILCSMVFLHPVFLAISILGAFCWSLRLNGRRGLRFTLIYLLPMMLLAGLINPLFNHRGVTILFYLRGNPITLESVYYGGAMALMFGAVILWFSCYNAVMTSDKFIYLFGRIIPSLSLIFSMILRFVPRFKTQLQAISRGQRCIGRDVSQGTLRERLRQGRKILSIMVSWALENAIDTADSMRSRGYGLPGRSSFALFRFDGRDKGLLTLMAGLLLLVGAGAFLGQNNIQYVPYVEAPAATAFSLAVYAAYALLCFGPVILDIKEDLKWRRLQSQI